MKKHFLYLMAAAAAMTACSTNDVVGDAGNGGGIVTTEDQQEIGIGTSINALSSQSAGTRATIGGVGNDAENKWPANTKLRFFMLQKNSIDPATEKLDEGDATAIFFDTEATTTNETASKVSRTDNAIKYYPLADSRTIGDETLYGFDFYGYHDGGAVTREGGAVAAKYYDATVAEQEGQETTIKLDEGRATKDDKSSVVGVPFTIDGSQDIMAGKAALTDDQKTALTDNYTERAYSAFAARRGVQPIIDFNHLLTRLQFNVKAGNCSTAGYAADQTSGTDGNWVKNDTVEAMQVVGISVIGKQASEGVLVVASTNNKIASGDIVWTEPTGETTNEFKLKNTEGTVISKDEAVALTGTFEGESNKKFSGKAVSIGDALLLQPGFTEYEVYITLSQKRAEASSAIGTSTDSKVERTQTIHGTIKLSGDAEFEKGTSYAVNITVYGYEHIDITANLKPWKVGDEIDTDTDTDDWSQAE